jgi:hypothetical protein
LDKAFNVAALPLVAGGCALFDLTSGEQLTPALEPPPQLPVEAPLLDLAPSHWRIRQSVLWDVSPTALPLEELRRLALVLSDHEVDETGSLVQVDRVKFDETWQGLAGRLPWSGPAAAKDLLAWQKRQAQACKSTGAWAVTLLHADALLFVEPNEPSHHALRGTALAALGQWSEARQALTKATSLGADDLQTLRDLALVCLAQDDSKAYRAACEKLLTKFNTSENRSRLETITLTCMAAPDPVGDPSRLIQRIADASDMPDVIDASSAFAVAAANLRRQRAEWTRDVLSINPEATPKALGLLLLGLAASGTDKNEARLALGGAVKLMDDPDFALVTSWQDQVIMRALRRELEKKFA